MDSQNSAEVLGERAEGERWQETQRPDQQDSAEDHPKSAGDQLRHADTNASISTPSPGISRQTTAAVSPTAFTQSGVPYKDGTLSIFSVVGSALRFGNYGKVA